MGYARVSTEGQNLAQQRGVLRESGCTHIFEEQVSGTKRDRPELRRLLDHLHVGDVVTVTRLDRLARSIPRPVGDRREHLRTLARAYARSPNRGLTPPLRPGAWC
jgi:DNA invertase Pin-like site-specific DNA recombinase